jgi:hypothetical protein
MENDASNNSMFRAFVAAGTCLRYVTLRCRLVFGRCSAWTPAILNEIFVVILSPSKQNQDSAPIRPRPLLFKSYSIHLPSSTFRCYMVSVIKILNTPRKILHTFMSRHYLHCAQAANRSFQNTAKFKRPRTTVTSQNSTPGGTQERVKVEKYLLQFSLETFCISMFNLNAKSKTHTCNFTCCCAWRHTWCLTLRQEPRSWCSEDHMNLGGME